MKNWTARDWRQVLGVAALAGGGMAVTVLAFKALSALADKSDGPWPVAYFAYGCLMLIGVVLFGFSAILGRRTFKVDIGEKTIEATGEDADSIMEKMEGN